MTMLKVGKKYWEWTILLDTFNNEILAHSVTDVPGSNKPYYDCLAVLNRLAGKKEEQKPQVVFHTDQGAVYSSKAFCQAHSLPHRPGSCLLFQGFLPSPYTV